MIIVKIILLTWFITRFELFKILIDYIKYKYIHAILFKLTSCMKCTGFWLGLILSQDIYIACAASLLSFLLDIYLLKKERLNNDY